MLIIVDAGMAVAIFFLVIFFGNDVCRGTWGMDFGKLYMDNSWSDHYKYYKIDCFF